MVWFIPCHCDRQVGSRAKCFWVWWMYYHCFYLNQIQINLNISSLLKTKNNKLCFNLIRWNKLSFSFSCPLTGFVVCRGFESPTRVDGREKARGFSHQVRSSKSSWLPCHSSKLSHVLIICDGHFVGDTDFQLTVPVWSEIIPCWTTQVEHKHKY